MPICCEPGERYAVVLDTDKGKDPEPTFWCQHLSARKFRLFTELGERMAAASTLKDQMDLLDEALRMAVCDWQNIHDAAGQTLPFQADGLLDIVTVPEAAELLNKIAAGQRVSGADSKKSESPSPCDSANTAAAAGPEPAAIAQHQSSH